MSDPLTGFRFIVTLDVADSQLPTRQAVLVPPLQAAGFQEVSGLGCAAGSHILSRRWRKRVCISCPFVTPGAESHSSEG